MTLTSRVTGFLLAPDRGLVWIWVVIVMTLYVVRLPQAASVVILVTFTLLWIAMLAVTALVPRPARLQDESALVSRVIWLIRVSWAAALFGLSAFYGALASAQLTAALQSEVFVDTNRLIWDLVSPIVAMVALFAGWYAVAGCAWDLWRVGAAHRDAAIARLTRRVPSAALREWLGSLLAVTTRGWLPWVLAYFVPVLLFAILAWLVPDPGLAPFRLF